MIILYSTNCPKCHVLEQKLRQKHLEYNLINDMDIMMEKGFISAPMLVADDKTMDFGQAIQWVNQQ